MILVNGDVELEETLVAIGGLGVGRNTACCPKNDQMNNKYTITRVTEKY